MPRLQLEPVETFLKFEEHGPVIEKWDVNGYVATREVKFTTEEALEMGLKRFVFDLLPNKRKLVWMLALLDTEALVVYCLPFVLKKGIPFPCKVMNGPRVPVNRDIQIKHLIGCRDCCALTCTDFHPTVIQVGSKTIWRIVLRGLIELFDTGFDPYPTFNGLPCLLDGCPSKHGKHQLIFGLGRHSKRNEHEWDTETSIADRAGFHQSRLLILMRFISNIKRVYGSLTIGSTDFKPFARQLLVLLQSDIDNTANLALLDIASTLAPLLREVSSDLVDSEPESVLDFRQDFYVKRTFEFKYTERAGQANLILDSAGLKVLNFIHSLPEMDFRTSLTAVFGSVFVTEFKNRMLIATDGGYRVRESDEGTPTVFSVQIIN